MQTISTNHVTLYPNRIPALGDLLVILFDGCYQDVVTPPGWEHGVGMFNSIGKPSLRKRAQADEPTSVTLEIPSGAAAVFYVLEPLNCKIAAIP